MDMQKSLCRFLGRGIFLLYKPNYLDSLIAACGAISKRGKLFSQIPQVKINFLIVAKTLARRKYFIK